MDSFSRKTCYVRSVVGKKQYCIMHGWLEFKAHPSSAGEEICGDVDSTGFLVVK